MKRAFGDYQRIARGSLGCSSLWLGSDHLLYVKGNGFLLPFSEEYKRFRYSDIQGLVMARTPGLVLGALAYLAGLAAVGGLCFSLLFFREPGDGVMLAITLAGPLPITVGLLALLIRHLVLGPRCVLEIQTEVKRERLRSANRVHQAREMINLIGERVRAAQSGLAAEAGPAGISLPIVPERAGTRLQLPPLAMPAFGLQIAVGGLLVLLLHLSSSFLAGAMLLAAMIGTIPLLVALAGSVRHRSPETVRQTLWIQLTTMLVLGAVSTVYFIDQAINDPAVTVGITGPIDAFAEISALGGFGFYLVFLVTAIANLGTGIAGLRQVSRWRSRLGPGPAPASIPDLPGAASAESVKSAETKEGQVRDDTLS